MALRLGAALGVESALTNGPIKACFRRVRPTDDRPPEGPLPYGMHRPISSSFPSGHAASAFTAAMLLADTPAAPVWFALAAAIAGSRVYTRMHHASDVIAGAALGIAARRDRAADRAPVLKPLLNRGRLQIADLPGRVSSGDPRPFSDEAPGGSP